jgi:hypothetical protein
MSSYVSDITDRAYGIAVRFSQLSIAEWMNVFACAVLLAFVVVMAKR